MAQAVISAERRYVGTKENLAYGIACGGQNMSYTFMASYLTYFFVNVFNIDAKAVAFMMLVLGVWDVINDPLMGSVIDKTRTRFGKLRPYLLVVPIPLAIFTVLLFSGPMFFVNEPSSTAIKKIVYMYLSYVIWEMFYTIGDVPFWGLSTAISPNPNDRARAITSARFSASIFGALPGMVIAPVIDLAQSGKIHVTMPQIFLVLGIVISIVGMGMFTFAGLFVKERVVQPEEQPSLLDSIKVLVTNKPLLLIILYNVLGAFGGIYDMFTNFLFIDVLHSATLGVIVGIPGAIINFVAYAFIPMFKKRMNSKQILIFSTVSLSVIYALTYITGAKFLNSSVWIVGTILAVRGALMAIFNGVRMVVPTEMVGDTVDYREWKTGQRSEGMSFAALTFVGKLTGTMQKSVGTWCLSLIGYVGAVGGVAAVQSTATQNGIWAMYTIVPAVLGLLGIIPLFFYDLVGEKQKKIRQELMERREKLAQQAGNNGEGEN